ncbi:MAG: IS3 family transposase [Deltaproteobacteria bacterium]|nr:IS3 family transposase [Deltaproteobacteria bacterium]
MKYAWIREQAANYPVALMCEVLGVSDSGYYEWRGRKPSERQKRQQEIADKAREFHGRSQGIYGYRKVFHDILLEAKIICCPETVRLVMRENGLFSKVKRKFVRTTDSSHDLPVTENKLGRNFVAEAPNQKWVADITYIPTQEGWLYLAGVMDLWSRRIIGWAMSDHIDTALVCGAMNRAVQQRQPAPGLIHHSDRGVQYAATDFQAILTRCGVECSMSRKTDYEQSRGEQLNFHA